MLHKKLIQPKSIVVIGGSDNLKSPGGKVLKNLIDHHFNGDLFVVNPRKTMVQGIKSFTTIEEVPKVDLAIIAIAAKFIPETVKVLTQEKNTKGFIIFSAGFSEKNEEGRILERDIVRLINQCGGSLLGPNNIGLINSNFSGVFTTPIPKLHDKGVDLISGSGATAVFIMEAAQRTGLTFSSVYSVGNSAQIGVEDVLEYFDQIYDKKKSSRVKILYIESIKDPNKFLKHSRSLIRKGCQIAAIKAGSSEEGNRAASSHTGAMANSDIFTEALFQKAGIIRCYSRNELIIVGGILMQKKPKGKNIVIITHAGGPAVMLTDILSKNGVCIPKLNEKQRQELSKELHEGSSTVNPIDFLATGTAEQLETIIDFCENKFNEADSIAIIFGSPGLTTVFDAYNILNEKIKICKKPIYAILPSIVNAKKEISEFISRGNIVFTDEVLFGKGLANVLSLSNVSSVQPTMDKKNWEIRKIIENSKNGYLSSKNAILLLDFAGIKFIKHFEVKNEMELLKIASNLEYPVVQKVVGPVHKSDVNGVILNVKNEKELISNFHKLMQIDQSISVLIQPMIQGIELFIGAKREASFPHLIFCGLGGIYIEILQDISVKMIPVLKTESLNMIKSLKSYPILKGSRGQTGINIPEYSKLIKKVSILLQNAPEIKELDINPLLASTTDIVAVDVRISIEK